MKSIGFIDYFLDEWHANNYPAMISAYNAKNGTDYKVAYAWGEIDSPKGMSNAEWCEKFGATLCQSIEELCEKSDYVIMLAPSNPEKHLGYAERVFKCGKSPYIDKTFTPTYADAKEIYRLASKHGVKFFSSSALRYADEIACYNENAKTIATVGGGSSIDEYIIHQIEMVVKCLGTGADKLRYTADGDTETVELSFYDQKAAKMTFNPSASFRATVTDENGKVAELNITSAFFDNLIADIIRFFESGEVAYKKAQTLEAMRIREAVLNAKTTPNVWLSLQKVRVGVIGCGRISVMHLKSLSLLPEVEIVACCDKVPEKADAAASQYKARAYYSYEEMFDKEKLDCVHICLPHYLHCKVACYAFEHGVSALTEKPMDIDLESAVMAVARAKECGVQFGVIFQCRYNNAPQLVKKRVESGRLGKIISARSVLTWTRPDSYYAESDWKGTWDKEGGGVVIDQAIHSLDLVNWVVDSEVESVSCTMANHGHVAVDVEDSAEGLVKYKNGVKYSFYCTNNYGCNEPIEIRLYCEKGNVIFGYDDALITYKNGEIEEAHQGENYDGYGNSQDYWGCQHVRQIVQFYNALLGKEELEINGDEGLKIHRLVMEIYDRGNMRK